MLRRSVISLAGGVTLAALSLAGPGLGTAFAAPRLIGALLLGTPSANSKRVEQFKLGMRDLGYIEERDYRLQIAWGSDVAPLDALARRLAAAQPEVVLVAGVSAAKAATTAMPVVPVIVGFGADLMDSGLTTSLARPSGQVTGISSLATNTSGKMIELIHLALPQARKLGILVNPANIAYRKMIEEFELAAHVLGVPLVVVPARDAGQIDAAFDKLRAARVDALVVQPDGVFTSMRQPLVSKIAQLRVATVFHSREFVDAGGFVSYGPNVDAAYRRAASFVDRIFKGARPGDLPIEQSTKFELVINMKTANVLGIKIPQSLLLQAAEVIA